MEEDIKRVFFHELGHYVAKRINQLLFAGPRVKSITIEADERFVDLYKGDTKTDGDNLPPTLVKLPQYLASLTYGCIFQAAYKKTSLQHCFEFNGGDDKELWIVSLLKNGYDWTAPQIENIEIKYFQKLMSEKELDELMLLLPEKYIVREEDEKYFVDLEKLQNDTEGFIKSHSKLFTEFIDSLRTIVY